MNELKITRNKLFTEVVCNETGDKCFIYDENKTPIAKNFAKLVLQFSKVNVENEYLKKEILELKKIIE